MTKNPQHFLKSSKARDLSLLDVARMSERQARELVRKHLWGDGEPVCPHCREQGAWRINSTRTSKDGTVVPRRLLKCKQKDCRKQFTLTSGTTFKSLKMPVRDRLLGLFAFSRGAKGFAALTQCYVARNSYKSAFVFEHKLREVLTGVTRLKKGEFLKGHVEADIVFIGGYKRPARHRKDRVDRRLKQYLTGKRQGICVIRERGSKGRVITFVVKNEADARKRIYQCVDESAHLYLDMAAGWGGLTAHYTVHEVDHSSTFARWEDGFCINTNQAESYNSRLRRAEVGTHHRIAGRYSGAYASEMAWREANRRRTAKDLFETMLEAVCRHRPVTSWLGYWGESPRPRALYT